MTTHSARPFGRLLTAMITPFGARSEVDADGVRELAAHLVDTQRCDGLVLNGTTGESATTSDAEKEAVVRAVVEAVGDRAKVVAGVGTNDTAHSIELARRAEEAGAHGLLVVTPYYNKPPQAGLIRHFTAIADATGLPVMLYDIPGRSGVPIETETIIRLAEHPRIVAVKDSKGDLFASQRVLAATDLSLYSGIDELNLATAAIGQVGAVSVVAHLVGHRLAEMYDAVDRGDLATARAVNLALVPAVAGLMTRTQGTIAVKAALDMKGLPAGPVRSPLVDADGVLREQLRADLAAAGETL
ncbi:4-hydroxy-tetrahydrodipicolinate synthase [Phytomonospora endophytica]|uniref:4-hydroxy-tetrahydrodipicolinate synthase n=1 Tax=Phytomonospora endophytica TaxID=714109 RepID=A0A841F8L2_9ACTN|nr:4-hydroxy-tetrahydrodipicolinate synthase [Phytomonospora endophytica]MBB6032566.1 4-hydroxy-tetrahydrodipicolinate synthase [Phytomonospora endophytica]GIG66284.1 4-hydroxy-tetrahydrodipicolinate synthase 2 [Phytomonospora endophytica]